MLVIQPKKFQECNITYLPESLMHDSVAVTENVIGDRKDVKNGNTEVIRELKIRSNIFLIILIFRKLL